MDNLSALTYKTELTRLSLGQSSKGKSVAKPILILSILELIESGKTDNHFNLDSKLQTVYTRIFLRYRAANFVTPLFKPFYYLEHDGFWHLKWRDNTEIICKSAKYIRDNVEYAFIDDSLWRLWQDEEYRLATKELLINTFLKEY